MVESYDGGQGLDWRPSTRRQASAVLVSLVASAMIAAAAAYFWSQFHQDPESPESAATLQEIRGLQQQMSGRIDVIHHSVAAAHTDLKKLSGQLSALAARVDALSAAQFTSSIDVPSDPRGQVLAPPIRNQLTPPKLSAPASIGSTPILTAPAPDQSGQR